MDTNPLGIPGTHVSTPEGWKLELTIEPSIGFWSETFGLMVPNHYEAFFYLFKKIFAKTQNQIMSHFIFILAAFG